MLIRFRGLLPGLLGALSGPSAHVLHGCLLWVAFKGPNNKVRGPIVIPSALSPLLQPEQPMTLLDDAERRVHRSKIPCHRFVPDRHLETVEPCRLQDPQLLDPFDFALRQRLEDGSVRRSPMAVPRELRNLVVRLPFGGQFYGPSSLESRLRQ